MSEISEVLQSTREASGVSLEEVSNDLEIPLLILKQIEEGNIGAFKDIFLLKEYISDYAKYLGLNPEEVIDEFNEYLFEITSKIPMDEIARAAKEKEAEEAKSERIASPYTKASPVPEDKKKFVIIILVTFLLALIIIWSILQITS